MRYFLIFLAFTMTATLGAQNWGGGKRIRGNGDVVKKSWEVRTFTGVDVCCSIDVEIRQGDRQRVEIEAESNVMPYLRAEVVGGRLDIGFRKNVNLGNVRQIRVYITMAELDYLGANSSSKIKTVGEFSGKDIDLDASSAGRIECAFNGRKAELEASSGGRIELRGRGETVEAEASSGGRANAGKFMAESGDADASSGGSVSVSISEALEAEASSGGSVRYSGEPRNVNADSSSGGSVRRE